MVRRERTFFGDQRVRDGHQGTGPAEIPGPGKNFLSRRFVRIVPIYWITMTLKIVRMRVGSSGGPGALSGWLQILASYLFVSQPAHSGGTRSVADR